MSDFACQKGHDGCTELERIADDLQTLVDTQASRIATQAARITALEAALRNIEAAWDDDAIPTEDVGGRMYLIARAALAPAPAPEGEWVETDESRLANARAVVSALTPAPAPAVPPLRYAYASEVTEPQRRGVWQTGLAALGDAILIWVNEGDFWRHKVEQYPKPAPAPAPEGE